MEYISAFSMVQKYLLKLGGNTMLKFKFWLKQFLVLFLFVILTITMILFFLRNQVSKTIKSEILRKGNNLIKMISEDLKTENIWELKDKLPKYMFDSDLTGIEIRGKNGTPIVQVGSTDVFRGINYSNKAIELKSHKVLILSDSQKKETSEYYIFVSMSYKHLGFFIKDIFTQLIIIGLILLVNIFLFIYLLIQKLIAPLEGLIVGTQSLADGNFEYKFEVDQDSELGHLARSFEDMKEKLKKANYDLKRSNTELLNLNEYTKNIIDSMKGSLIALNREGKIMFLSKGRRDLPLKINYPFEGMPLKNVFPELPSNVVAKVKELTQKKTGDSELKNFKLKLKDDDHFFDFFFSTIFDRDNVFIGILILLDDVTERVYLEDRLSHSQKLAALGEFSAAIAHEIRNPLGIIKVSASSVMDTIDRSDSSYKLLDFIIGETDRLANVIEKLLNFARPKRVEKEFTDIKKVIQEFVKYGKQNPRGRNIKFEESYSEGLPQTPLDKDQFSEVMINIIDNAIDSIPEESKGKIKVSTEYISSSNTVKITISDNGTGIKVNLRDKIFEPFFTTKDTGTGLGLTISHKIIENHNGTIQVESDPKTGTTFIITLPAE